MPGLFVVHMNMLFATTAGTLFWNYLEKLMLAPLPVPIKARSVFSSQVQIVSFDCFPT